MDDVQPRDVFLVANNVEELGGVQRVAHNLADILHARGHRVQLVGVDHAPVPYDYGQRPYAVTVLNETKEPRAVRAGGLRRRLDPRVARAAAEKNQHRAAAVAKLSALLREAPEGFVIVLQVWAMHWVSAADTSRHKVVGMSHESYGASTNSARYKRILRFYRDLDLFLLLTESDARRFERDGFNNVAVMHNPISFYPDEPSDLSAKVVIAAGRYSPEKGYGQLIDAFAQVVPDHPDWTLKIFGHGPLRDELGAQVERLGLAANVAVPGLARDIERELVTSSIFALSSIHEGLPMALAEAMGCGLAAAAYDCAPGVREILTVRTSDGERTDGIVVPPRDVPALAEAIRRLIEDEDLRRTLGARARDNVRRFAPDAIGQQWEQVFALLDR
jgi:glycosyltransferase involved in cell wall biosynthesis